MGEKEMTPKEKREYDIVYRAKLIIFPDWFTS